MIAKIGNILRMHKQSGDRQPPLWFTEGLAEAWSTEWDATAEMVIKDAVLTGYMVGLNDWEQYYGTFFMYKMGQNAINYIAEKYGKEKILLLMENFWMNEDFSTVMEKTIGKNYDTFDKEWLYHLKKQYFPTLLTDDNPSANTEKIFVKGFGHKPAYYNDGKREYVFLIGNVNGYTSVYKVDLKQNKKTELILEGEKTEQLEEFHYFRTGMDVSSTGILAFATKSGGTDALHFYDIRADKIINDYHFDNIVQIGAPSFSREGDKVYFSALDRSGKSDLYLFDVAGNKLTRLTNDYYDDRDPDISPNGKTLVFSSDRTSYGAKNRYNLFTMNLVDNSISYLTCGDESDFSPQFSEDGSRLVFTSTIGGTQNIWYMELDNTPAESGSGETIRIKNSQLKKLTNFTTAAFDPKWIDKKRIIFASYESGITVRMLDSVNNIIDTPVTVKTINYNATNQTWTANKTTGNLQRNDLRYKKDYSLDIATSDISQDPVFGTTTGGVVAMSDILGNDQYYFLIYNNSQTGDEFFKNINIAISRVSLEHRLNYAYGIFHLSGKRYSYGDEFSYYERNFGGYYALSYPLSFFQRIDASISLSNSFRDLTEAGTINRRALLLTNSLSYVKDNSIWGPTGPLDGERLNVTLSYTTDIQFGNVNYYSLIFDYRKYFRLSNPVALALRLEYLKNQGKEAKRWAIGGSWDLRGWPRFGIRGEQAFVASAELRFPLINIFAVHFPFGLNFDFPYIRGAAFFDAGNAWDNIYGQTLGSVGIGARVNVFNIIALRYDIGKRIENNFKNFQSGLFQQFFFGWDF